MLVKEFINSLRTGLNDTGKSKFSDFELIESLNSVLGIFSNELVKIKSNLIVTSVSIVPVNGLAILPTDFASLYSIFSGNNELFPYKPIDDFGYKLTKDTIQVNVNFPNIVVSYYQTLAKVNMNDILPVPNVFIESLKKYVALITKGEVSPFDDKFNNMIHRDLLLILVGREYSSLDRELPFYV